MLPWWAEVISFKKSIWEKTKRPKVRPPFLLNRICESGSRSQGWPRLKSNNSSWDPGSKEPQEWWMVKKTTLVCVTVQVWVKKEWEETEQNISSSCFIGLFYDILNFYNARLNQSTLLWKKAYSGESHKYFSGWVSFLKVSFFSFTTCCFIIWAKLSLWVGKM